ncbi:MAG: hypothetical protein AAB510_02475 [Patescibacteria group bacterium]
MEIKLENKSNSQERKLGQRIGDTIKITCQYCRKEVSGVLTSIGEGAVVICPNEHPGFNVPVVAVNYSKHDLDNLG